MKLTNPFKLPTPEEAARKELAQAELSLLQAHTLAEHARANLEFQHQRVARLRGQVAVFDRPQREQAKDWAKPINFGGQPVDFDVSSWPEMAAKGGAA